MMSDAMVGDYGVDCLCVSHVFVGIQCHCASNRENGKLVFVSEALIPPGLCQAQKHREYFRVSLGPNDQCDGALNTKVVFPYLVMCYVTYRERSSGD